MACRCIALLKNRSTALSNVQALPEGEMYLTEKAATSKRSCGFFICRAVLYFALMLFYFFQQFANRYFQLLIFPGAYRRIFIHYF